MHSQLIYADYAASTPCSSSVIAAMQDCLLNDWGNPSSEQYPLGRRALQRVGQARRRVAQSLGVRGDEICFTSGATESCNMAIKGIAAANPQAQIVLAAGEHAAVEAAAQTCAAAGIGLKHIPLDQQGLLQYEALDAALTQPTSLVAVMLVNNHSGVMQDLPLIAERCHAAGALLFSDITQALARHSPLALADWGLDLAACSAHKVYGPKGCGAFFRRRGLSVHPLIDGGGQEFGLRSGTENVAGIVGFAQALTEQAEQATQRLQRLQELARNLEAGLAERIPELCIHGVDAPRAPGISLISSPRAGAGWLARVSTKIACSGGSACSGNKPNPLLLAMGYSKAIAGNALRISLSHLNQDSDIQTIIEVLTATYSG